VKPSLPAARSLRPTHASRVTRRRAQASTALGGTSRAERRRREHGVGWASLNLARAEQLTGHWVDALTHYKLFVADNTVTGSDRETARKRIAELTPLVGHVTVVAPSGADLWIDGQMLPRKAPLSEPADVSAGMHTVQARLGDQTKSVGISCQAGQTVTAKIDIEITGTPVVVVPMPGEGGPPPPPAQPEQPNPPTHYVASGAKIGTTVAFGVAAVAGIAVGVGMQVAAGSKGNDVTADHTQIQNAGGNPASFCSSHPQTAPCPDEVSQASSHTTDENVRTGAFIGAGVLAAAAILTWMAWPNDKAVESARLVPLLSPNMAGLGCIVAF
jgi:hypothetical protein